MIEFPDLEALSRHAAGEFAALAQRATRTLHVALSGGSTPKRLFAELVAMGRDALPWDRVELWWGDERCVPPDHPDSNYGMTKRALIDPLGLSRVHRIEGERDPDAAAASYEHELAALGTPPVFDLVWLGMGPDGHTASLFPGSPALAEQQRFCVANRIDSPLTHGKATRITLTYPALNAARLVRFLVAGADKADTLARVHAGADLPCTHVTGNVSWLVDAAAAAKLEKHT
jgi:6-phosphogluconolactonase